MDYSEYIDFSAGFQEAAEDSGEGSSHQAQQHFTQATSAPQEQSKAAFFHPGVPHQMSCDIKPRLTKEQHDVLEAHYQKQNKPNTNTKKGFAEALGVSLDKVNVSLLDGADLALLLNKCYRIGSRTAGQSPNRMRRRQLAR